ncbi:Glycerophosphocholine phosphodiesterase [Lithohypha guttulata]|uniref:Glycerophosphocholine phosphodiesterase n=1 Tax=Lithohypha guttulata TaxID=1690604 RepID=UPI002DE0B8C6|nr:Glycerophosphocholine phosphodiesterase [Lithohypha guttulata]
MKFGRSLPQRQVPEWAANYINYKALKKLIKNAQLAGKTEEQRPDLAGFFYTLDRNLEDVDSFYNKKYQDFARRLKILEDRYGATQESVQGLEKEEREDLFAGLRELRGQFRKLQGYGEINRKGFVKITKKLDKKIEGSHAQQKYLHLKVDPCPFATNAGLHKSVAMINDWLHLLGEAASDEEAGKKTIIPPKLHKSASREALRIPDDSWVRLERSIREDDAQVTEDILTTTRAQRQDVSELQFQQFLKGLLQRAITSRSRRCLPYLLSQIVFLDDAEDINKRNSIHRLVISIGRAYSNSDRTSSDVVTSPETELYSYITPAEPPSKTFKTAVQKDDERSSCLTDADEPITYLNFLLDSLSQDQRLGLGSKDAGGRMPLHFAAEYGIPAMVRTIVDHLQTWGMLNIKDGIDGPFWQDNDGWAPLHLAVIGGHPLTTQVLLDTEALYTPPSGTQQARRRSPKSSAALAIATKSNFIEVVRTLVQAGVDINCQDEQDETALHVAARFGHTECARILLTDSNGQKCDTEIRESTYGWTPLLIASVDGHLPIVELLAEAGADLEKVDWSGWSAKEHAALRGHMELATRLADLCPTPAAGLDVSSPESTSPPKTSALTDRTSNGVNHNVSKVGETIKEFGHRYLTDKSMVLVSLGTMDMHSKRQAVNLDHVPLTNASSTQLDTALSIIVSAKGAEGEPDIIDLPVRENITTEPIVFHTLDPSKVKILFDLIPTYAGDERIVGRGVALLSSIKSNLGNRRMPLQGDISVPIIAAGDLEVIGSVTFNFLVITPFQHPKMSISKEQTYWKKVAQTMVIGHRGLGKNFASGRRSLQLGENTIQSFIAAANLGASYVEFDVQLTKDHVPVIYHDFLVSETGIDAPVHTLTLEQFLHVNDSRTPRHSRPPSPAPFENPSVRNLKNGDRTPRGRSMSVGGGQPDNFDMEERMKHTRDFKKKGFKGNSRGNHIQAPFATLEELFEKLPVHVGFNIEMKYPMLSESQDEDMDWYAVELNSFVDTVLTKVYDLGEGRNVMFSSFNPDICLLLAFKQPSIPVLFLTDAGSSPVADIRASSLQEAIRFAARWNLLGIVAACQPFVIAPRLVKVVKESGLVCVSYGTLNNQTDKVDLQVQQGIDAVIVDSVLKIRRGLREEPGRSDKPSQQDGLVEKVVTNVLPQIPQQENLALKAESIASSATNISLTGSSEDGTTSSEPAMNESPGTSAADIDLLAKDLATAKIRPGVV